jgi:hypothetical protein
MKNVYFLCFLSLISISIHAQIKPAFDEKISINKSDRLSLPTGLAGQQIYKNVINRYSDLVPNHNRTSFTDTINTSLTDTMMYNMYGDLLNDNPLYNKKASLWAVALGVTMTNATILAIDRYIFKYPFSYVGFNSWEYNLKTGWEWDTDRFGMNYFFHPFSGSMYFNCARANGYSFFESAPFALLGSLEWEYFGETTLPSYNDVINTPVNGIFLGEVLYRLGSNILDDQTSGANRFFREAAVAIITPTRFFSRLLQGELTRSTTEEVYQKEPLNIKLSSGYHYVNEGTDPTTDPSTNSVFFNLYLDYGNPFEKRARKPFDFFKLGIDLDFGTGRKIIDIVSGHGILFGSNVQTGNLEMLAGLYQHYDFFDNNTFEIGNIGLGPGITSKLPISKASSLYTNLFLNIVPFGAQSNLYGPDTTQTIDYNYVGGAEGKLECTLNLGGWTEISFIGYYWWLHTYVGIAGNSYVGLTKPKISFRIFDKLSVGFEHLIYFSDIYPYDLPNIHSVRTEERIYLQFFIEEFKFKR